MTHSIMYGPGYLGTNNAALAESYAAGSWKSAGSAGVPAENGVIATPPEVTALNKADARLVALGADALSGTGLEPWAAWHATHNDNTANGEQ